MLLIFDLDGTLIDSAQDLAVSMNATRTHLGMSELDPQLIYSFVGNGAAVLVRRAIGPDASQEVVDEGLRFFLQFYRRHALQHTRLYPGVQTAIEKLHSSGHTLAVLTNKPVRISTDIIAALGLSQRFVRVCGGDTFAAKKPDPIGIATLMAEANAVADGTLMIGDSSVDVQTALNAGVRSCGVLWGFQPDSLTQSPPDFVVKTPDEWLGIVSIPALR